MFWCGKRMLINMCELRIIHIISHALQTLTYSFLLNQYQNPNYHTVCYTILHLQCFNIHFWSCYHILTITITSKMISNFQIIGRKAYSGCKMKCTWGFFLTFFLSMIIRLQYIIDFQTPYCDTVLCLEARSNARLGLTQILWSVGVNNHCPSHLHFTVSDSCTSREENT